MIGATVGHNRIPAKVGEGGVSEVCREYGIPVRVFWNGGFAK